MLTCERIGRLLRRSSAGDKYDLVAKQGTWGRGEGRKVAGRGMAHASGGSITLSILLKVIVSFW
jgi:hypothetical protein